MIKPYLVAFSEAVKVPYDQVLLISVMFACIPLALFQYLIKKPTIRLIYSLVFGLLFQYIIYGFMGIFHTFLATIYTYCFIVYYGRKHSSFWVFGITFCHLTILAIEKRLSLFNKWTIGSPATVYMMTICKYSSLAFSYEDGAKEDKDIKNEHMRLYKLVDKPTFLETVSFVYFYPTCIIGPSFDFKDYIDYINFRNCYSRIPFGLTMQYGATYLILTLLSMAVYAGLGKRFTLEFVGTIEYGDYPLWYRLFYINIAIIVHRAKFYSGFILSYTSLLFSGVSYGESPRKKDDPPVLRAINGDYQISFDKGSYGSIYGCELGLNPKTKITSWNHSIHLWLKYNCFLRLINVNNKFLYNNYAFSGIMTYLLSAFWHGFYITYYIFFCGLYLYQTGNEVFDKLGLFEYAEKKNSLILNILIWFQAQFIINGLGAIFFLLKYDLFIQYMKNVYGIPMILAVAAFVLSKFLVVKRKKQQDLKEKSQ